MPSAEQISTAVTEYVSRLSTGTSTSIADLFAEAATVEDPVGDQVRTGRDAIVAFFSSLDNMTTKAELLTVRVAGESAAFHMRVTTSAPSRTLTIEPIDVITVDDHGKITSLRAYWGPEDFTTS